MSNPRVRAYIDDNPEPIVDKELPLELELDTRQLADGPHRLIVRAEDQSGTEGVEEIPFEVQNGPGILVSGLRANTTRRGTVHLNVDAFSSDDPFDPRRAEARSAIPTWVWVMILVILAWVVFYVATTWEPPQKFRDTPTYSSYSQQADPQTGGQQQTSQPVAATSADGAD